MEQVNLGTVIDQVCQEKRISKDVLIETVEQAVLRAAEKVFPERLMEAEFEVSASCSRVVDVQLPRELSLEQARRSGLEAESAMSRLPHHYLETECEREALATTPIPAPAANSSFGRIAAQTAKQVIIQRVREAERENLFDQYKHLKGGLDLIVRRYERGAVIVEVDNGRAGHPDESRSRGVPASGSVSAYVKDVDKSSRGSQIILSRTHKGLVERLFAKEVPEIFGHRPHRGLRPRAWGTLGSRSPPGSATWIPLVPAWACVAAVSRPWSRASRRKCRPLRRGPGAFRV